MLRITPSEREVDRVLERQRRPCGKLGCKQLGPERGLEPRQRSPLDVIVLLVGGTETRRQFLRAAEQASSHAGVAGLGFHRGEAEQRPELGLDQPDLGRRLEPAVVEVARAVEVTEAVRRPAEVVVRPRPSVEVAARLADRQALLEELDRRARTRLRP